MERTLSDYEKIKKAEEIYIRRKMQGVGGVRVASPTLESGRVQKKRLSSVTKMVLQICICVVLYFIVYLVQNSNYIFSEQFIEKTRELLNYDINFSEQIENIKNYFENNFKGFVAPATIENQTEEQNTEEQNVEQQEEIPNEENDVEDEQVETMSEAVETSAVGGSEVDVLGAVDTTGEETHEEKSQMELDAEYIRNNYNLGLPLKLKGEVTSPYGEREVEPKFHVGTDIGVNTGTDILAAEDGVATLVSTTGDYGKHIKITSGDLVTLYAHCSTLNVTEGQSIKKGDKIAEVGQTGNATGPHLHFEIIFQGRYVDPQMLLNFE